MFSLFLDTLFRIQVFTDVCIWCIIENWNPPQGTVLYTNQLVTSYRMQHSYEFTPHPILFPNESSLWKTGNFLHKARPFFVATQSRRVHLSKQNLNFKNFSTSSRILCKFRPLPIRDRFSISSFFFFLHNCTSGDLRVFGARCILLSEL